MANNTNPPQPSNTGTKTPWLLIVLLLIGAAGTAVGGTYFYMSGSDPEAGIETAEKEPPPPPPEPVFVAVEPFTVNLQDARGRILYVGVSLKVADEAVASRLTGHMPQVRNRILMTLTSQEADTLTTLEGKQALAQTLRATVSEPFVAEAEPLKVSDVLFTNFIVQ